MRGRLALFVVLVAVAAPGTAQAHNSHGWFWSVSLAQTRYRVHYGVHNVSCMGIGQHLTRYNEATAQWQKLYRHFDCFDTDADGDDEEVTLHVRGHYAFSVYQV